MKINLSRTGQNKRNKRNWTQKSCHFLSKVTPFNEVMNRMISFRFKTKKMTLIRDDSSNPLRTCLKPQILHRLIRKAKELKLVWLKILKNSCFLGKTGNFYRALGCNNLTFWKWEIGKSKFWTWKLLRQISNSKWNNGPNRNKGLFNCRSKSPRT